MVDDLLDYFGREDRIGKPVHNDLKQGLVTLPLLYAAEQFPQLREMMQRKFSLEGDVDRVQFSFLQCLHLAPHPYRSFLSSSCRP